VYDVFTNIKSRFVTVIWQSHSDKGIPKFHLPHGLLLLVVCVPGVCSTLHRLQCTCNALQLTAAHYITLHHAAREQTNVYPQSRVFQVRAAYWNTLHHTATHCSLLYHTAPHCKRANARLLPDKFVPRVSICLWMYTSVFVYARCITPISRPIIFTTYQPTLTRTRAHAEGLTWPRVERLVVPRNTAGAAGIAPVHVSSIVHARCPTHTSEWQRLHWCQKHRAKLRQRVVRKRGFVLVSPSDSLSSGIQALLAGMHSALGNHSVMCTYNMCIPYTRTLCTYNTNALSRVPFWTAVSRHLFSREGRLDLGAPKIKMYFNFVYTHKGGEIREVGSVSYRMFLVVQNLI